MSDSRASPLPSDKRMLARLGDGMTSLRNGFSAYVKVFRLIAAEAIARVASALPFHGADRLSSLWRVWRQWLYRVTPKGLYGRSLLIIILPMVILQCVVTIAFMDRHWQAVTRRLSSMVTSNIAAIIELYEAQPAPAAFDIVRTIARDRLELQVDILSPSSLPVTTDRPFFLTLDWALSRELRRQIGREFWIDTVGRSNLIEIRINLEENRGVIRFFVDRNRAYASNSHIFILWMVGTSFVLIAAAILFLRNQIRPIQRLAYAAEEFGKGREVADFTPRGAREVRRAAIAFLLMKRRIERQIEQRTTMLNGVSHDLRTMLTRFKLQLAVMKQSPEIEELQRDTDDMQRMLETYLAFARGDADESSETVDIASLLGQLVAEIGKDNIATHLEFSGDPQITVRPHAFKRCLLNLLVNAAHYATIINVIARHEDGKLTIIIDDNGPGIPPDLRDDVFRPFFRIDESRNQDTGGTGLGLAIAREVATSHGGNIILDQSPLGGLRAQVEIPA
ncbi:ATP-binding protein [Candidatus Raskinella chloraquaticus]|uniref:ATP-binding protein n=1 Tax=Candidatus Raskinella chloraquaticus TaxID=1951219 RepID=UPI0026A348C4